MSVFCGKNTLIEGIGLQVQKRYPMKLRERVVDKMQVRGSSTVGQWNGSSSIPVLLHTEWR